MTSTERYDRAIWICAIIAIVAVLFINHGCSMLPDPKTSAAIAATDAAKERCKQMAIGIVLDAATCQQAQNGLDSLASREPSCVVVLGGDMFGDYCHGDGGAK